MLPEWKSPDILEEFDETTGKPILGKAARAITLRQLLTHSSGMAYDSMSHLLTVFRRQRGLEPGTFRGDIVRRSISGS